jgi:hypothetical protein
MDPGHKAGQAGQGRENQNHRGDCLIQASNKGEFRRSVEAYCIFSRRSPRPLDIGFASAADTSRRLGIGTFLVEYFSECNPADVFVQLLLCMDYGREYEIFSKKLWGDRDGVK